MKSSDTSGGPQAAITQPDHLQDDETCRVARETRAFQAQILANIRDAVVAIDENDLISYCNRAFEKMFGWTEQELLGQPYQSFIKDYIKEQYKEAVCSLPEDSREATGEVGEDRLYVECIAKDGQSLMVDISRAVWRGSEGEYKGIIASIRDMTERHQVELALQESEKKYRELVQYAPAAIYQFDYRQRRFLSVNDVMCDATGYSREELLQMDPFDILDEEGARQLQQRIRQYLNGEQLDRDVVYSVRTRDGGEIQASLHVTISCHDDGQPLTATVIGHDITALQRAKEELKQFCDELEETVKQRTLKLTLERQRLLDVLETLPVNICLLNADHHLVFSNRAYRKRFGDFQGRKCYEALFNYDQPCEFCETYTVLETGLPTHWVFTGPDGGIFDIYDCPFTDADGSELVLEMNIEISEQKRAEEALRRSEERFAKIFAASPVIMGITGLDHRFVEVNEAFIKAFGYSREEVLGRTSRELDMWVEHPHILGAASKLAAQHGLNNYEVSYRNAAGDERTGLGSTQLIAIGEANYYLHTMVDITQQKQIEAELSRLDRLNLIGEMAAAIGHEIRNPLTAVRGFLQILGAKEAFGEHQAYFELMIEELDRANAIISEYLAMAKDKRIDLQYHFLDDLITTLNPMIVSEANLREMNVKLDLNQPPPALVDHNEFRQMILNLTHNALDAMQPRGTLIIGTRQEGDEILLYIKDEGCGLPLEIYPKLGTPFVTTKDNGTGLGLAVCYSIAARHQALIDFETSPSGTTVMVRFPNPLPHVKHRSQ